jgi:hypothetical protein
LSVAAAAARASRDGSIASSIGSAIAVPTPRKNVRRLILQLALIENLIRWQVIGKTVAHR